MEEQQALMQACGIEQCVITRNFSRNFKIGTIFDKMTVFSIIPGSNSSLAP
jgi:hypothetical protein